MASRSLPSPLLLPQLVDGKADPLLPSVTKTISGPCNFFPEVSTGESSVAFKSRKSCKPYEIPRAPSPAGEIRAGAALSSIDYDGINSTIEEES